MGTPKNPEELGTIVMANYGYFQFKANPGVWQLRVREGRSSMIYEFADSDTEFLYITVSTFKGDLTYLALKKKSGMEQEEVLKENNNNNENSNVWETVKNAFYGTAGKEEDVNKQVSRRRHADINVFSVASGHLYERFLRIMMISVMKNTDSTVKFWFIKNFLSPSFKESVPILAEKYGFEYEYVTYKWPKWLRAQKEKQRVIWGYKILFLDVLFPLDLDKVIYVDADQTVRGDLKELIDLDLRGAAYGYAPFCDSNKETDGFRFWKHGWWAQHLGGRPYHISALYVVDLKRFRMIAAGDRLRGQYQGLSADPGSLANLDQDLPNHMQHNLIIHTLPQEWLWCETWCSKDSLKQAKTIDLCNNPLTKEPKLTMATRIVSEWSDYDNEIRELLKNANLGQKNKTTTSTSSSSNDKKRDEL